MSRLKDLMVEIGFDVSDVEKGIGKLSKQFDDLGKEFVKKAVKRAPKDPFNIGAERTRTQKFIRQIKDLNKEVGDYQKKLKTLKTPKEFKDFQKQIQKDVTAFKRAEQQKTKVHLAEAARRKNVSDKNFQDSVKGLSEKGTSKSAKDSAKTFYPELSRDLKAEKDFAEKQKMISDARIKQATGNLTSVSGKSAKDSASVFSKSLDLSEKEIASIREKNRLKYESYNKDRQARLKDSQDAQNALQKRLSAFKKAKKAETDIAEKEIREQKKLLKTISDARIKQTVKLIVEKPLTGKKAKDSASVFSNSFDTSEKELKVIREKNRLRNEMYGKERQARLKSSQDAQKALQKRLKDFKKSKQKELDQHKSTNKEKLSDTERYLKRARRLEEQLRFSANFRRLPDQEKNRFEGQIKSARKLMVTEGSDYGFRKLSSDVREFRRSLIGLHTVQMGLTDSARNMLRAYASVFALVESTAAIERIGMDFQGMEVAMLASAGTAQKAAKDLEFVKDLADEMGLNLKDSADAYVKLQMASRGKMDDSQIKELFQGLTEFGTALKVAPESMKLAQRALSQMASKGQIMAI